VVAGCVTGCGTATGARKEGPAPTATVKTPSTAAPAIASQPTVLAEMMRRDTGVGGEVREDLTPCADNDYPLDTDAGNLTAGDGPDLVVNVTTCGEGLGIASYVYRMIAGKYQNVFADEKAPVYGSVHGGQLEVVHEVYDSDDPVAYPIGEESTTYTWRGNHFVEVARSYADLAAPSPSASPEPVSTEPVPLPRAKPLDPELPSAQASASGTGSSTGSSAASSTASSTASPSPTP
jgi:hypothetical protein